MFRISRHENEPPIDVHTYKAILAVIRSSKPGRYAIAEIQDSARAPGDNGQQWGVGVKDANGSIRIDRIPVRA
jgi:hypothetical protein